MLREKLLPVYDGIPIRFERVASRFVAEYVSEAITSNQYRSGVRKLPEPFGLRMLDFKTWMDSSEVVFSLWRAIYRHFQGESVKEATVSCDTNDFLWILDQLSEDDLAKITKVAEFKPVQMISEQDVNWILKDLSRYAWSLAHRKLRFIAQYDNAYDVEDLYGEIICEIVRNVRMWQHLGNRDKVKGFAMRAAHNEMVKIIEFNTAKSRARIQSVAQTVDSSLPQYRVTTLSLDTPASDDNESSMHSILPTTDHLESDALERDFFKKLTAEVAPRVRRLIHLVCDDFDEEFENWLRNTKGLDPDKVHRYDSLRIARLASEHLNVQLDTVREVVALRITGQDENQRRVS